jgi:hypothetical protein
MAETKDLKNVSKPLTIEDVHEQTRLYMERLTRNKVEIAGVIRGKNKSEPKPKIDKKTNEPIFNDDGTPAFWAPYHYVTLAFEGGELEIPVDVDMYNGLDIGMRVLMEGVKGLKFGKVQDNFFKYTVL